MSILILKPIVGPMKLINGKSHMFFSSRVMYMKQLKNNPNHNLAKHHWLQWIWKERKAGAHFLRSLTFLEKKEDHFLKCLGFNFKGHLNILEMKHVTFRIAIDPYIIFSKVSIFLSVVAASNSLEGSSFLWVSQWWTQGVTLEKMFHKM
jgi:hypothetical protein